MCSSSLIQTIWLAAIALVFFGACQVDHSRAATQSSSQSVSLPSVSFFRSATSGDRGKKVFAHYMLCCGAFGETPSAYAEDIRLARAMGVDGFAINVGGWSRAPAYKDRMAALFAAAKNLGSGFDLFISADMCCGLSASDILDMMHLYANEPTYLHEGGRPVLSTYSGENKGRKFWQNNVLAPLEELGLKPYFVPAFYSVTSSGLPSDEVAYWKGVVDGLFYFGPAQIPFGTHSVVATNLAYARALRSAGKLFLAGYYPFYWGSEQTTAGRRYYEYEGGRGTAIQWESLIADQDATWVEVVTWNDFNESYLVAPQPDPSNFYKPHTAFMELNRYYIAWFKSGVQPELTKDAIFYFYRTQPMSLKAANDPLGPVISLHGDVEDDLYLTIALTTPGELRVISGGIESRFQLPKGISQLNVPFHVGNQQFQLWRNHRLLSTLSGEPVLSTISVYNFLYTTGFAETPP